MKALAALGLAVLLLLAPSAASQVPDDKLIVPGQRIGKWTLEMTISALVETNGPQNVPPNASRSGTPIDLMSRWFQDSNDEIWWHWWSNIFFSAATRGRDTQQVEYVFTGSGDFKTDKNISPGMVREDVEAAYGQPTAVTTRAGTGQAAGRRRLVYDDIGLAALISQSGVVEMLFVFRPKTGRKLWIY